MSGHAPPAAAEGATVTSDGIVVRYRAPAADLATLVTDYGFYDSGAANAQRRDNDYLPGLANVCLTFDGGPVHARIRNRALTWTNAAVLFGPTSRAMQVESNGGRLVGFGVTPLGWARLFARPARAYADRVVPLDALLPRDRVAALYRALHAARDEDTAAAALDAAIRALLRPLPRDAATVIALAAAVQDADVVECAQIAERLDLPPTQLRRVAHRHFGFGTKLLLRRTRFLRAAAALMAGGDAQLALAGYYDHSHFIRDAQQFLGKTARQFAGAQTPLMAAMQRGRAARFGKPLQSQIEPGRDNLPHPLDAPVVTP
jgi:hypothetical protein